ncbi:MAG: SOS response-associated peptidase [Anaerolineae bacterium]|nr:SOS response-associated peptidase [Anaerolineae bacterium]
MCGRYTLAVDKKRLAESFSTIEIPEQLAPRYNIAPSQPVAVVANNAPDKVELFLWGLIPSWAKDPSIGNRMINARAETLAEKPSFKNAYKRRRCLVLADGFFEWKKGPDTKTPMYIRLASSNPFAFAGLWESWHGADGSHILSCTIITTTPNELMANIHNRMPVILAPEAYEQWLDPAECTPTQLSGLLKPYPAEQMTAYPVSRAVNNPRNDTPECITPLQTLV